MIENEEYRRRTQRLDDLAQWLDTSIPLPGTRFRIGWDAIIGLIPFAGDFIGGAVSIYIITESVRLRTPFLVVLRMIFNILVELIIGSIPIAGDIFDFGWKANVRNIRLLQEYGREPDEIYDRTRRQLISLVLATVVGLLALFSLTIYVAYLLVAALFDLIGSLALF